jgi:hypothetical protein
MPNSVSASRRPLAAAAWHSPGGSSHMSGRNAPTAGGFLYCDNFHNLLNFAVEVEFIKDL